MQSNIDESTTHIFHAGRARKQNSSYSKLRVYIFLCRKSNTERGRKSYLFSQKFFITGYLLIADSKKNRPSESKAVLRFLVRHRAIPVQIQKQHGSDWPGPHNNFRFPREKLTRNWACRHLSEVVARPILKSAQNVRQLDGW